MKTLQETLREVNRTELIETFIHEHPPVYDTKEKLDYTVGRILEMYKALTGKLIDKLATIEIPKTGPGDRCFLYACRQIGEDLFDEPYFSMVMEKDLARSGVDAISTSYIMVDHAEVAGFYVSDSEYARSMLYEMLADVLFEASWFGFNQEYLKEEREKLETSAREAEAAVSAGREFESANAFLKDIYASFGLIDETDEEKALHKKVMDICAEYFEYSRKKELGYIMQQAGILVRGD